jgi:hypothetical protein
MTSLPTFVSAEAGLFGDLATGTTLGPGYPIKPDQWVWAVTFKGDWTICPPPPAATVRASASSTDASPSAAPAATCFPPSPGVMTYFIDYFTGEYLGGYGHSAP